MGHVSQSLASAHYTSLRDNLQQTLQRGVDIKIALLLPLSGEKEPLGRSLMESAQLALCEGTFIHPLTLYPLDTNHPERLLDDIRSLQPSLILGPVFGQETKALAPKLPQSLPLFTLSNDPDLLNKGVFVMGFSPFDEAAFLLNFAFIKGHKRFAILLPENSLGHALEKTCKEVLKDKAGATLHILFYSIDEDPCMETVSNWVHQLNAFEPDALFIPDGSAFTQKLVATLKFKDLHYRRIRFLASSKWDKASVFKDSSLRGLWVASNRSKSLHHFHKSFQKAFQESSSPLGTLMYETLLFIGSSPSLEKKTLEKHKAKGIYGPLTLADSGAASRPWHVLEHTGRGVKRVQEK